MKTAFAMRSLWYLWAFFFNSSIGSAKEVTLETYLNEVRGANPTIRSSQFRAQALERKVRPNSTLDDPFIAAGLDQIPFGGAGSGSERAPITSPPFVLTLGHFL